MRMGFDKEVWDEEGRETLFALQYQETNRRY